MSLKALDEGYSSKNYVRKFFRALHPKWRAKVTKKESSDEECSTFESEDEETPWRCGDPNHLIGECPKPLKDKNQRAFVGGSWSDSGEEYDEKVNNETCLDAQAISEICLGVDLEPDEWIKDSGCSKHMTGNRKLFSSYKAYNRGNVIFGSNLRGNIIGKGQICDNKCRVTFSEHDSEITKERCLELLHIDLFGPSAVRSNGGNRYTLVIVDDYSRKVEESLNVTFIETPPPSKTSPLVDADLDEEEVIKVTEKKNLENDIEDETLEIDKILVPQPRNMTIIGTKWVFRNKLDENDIVSRNKATLVAQGYNQQEGIDYDETYALCILNGFINEEVYVAQPLGFIDFEKPDHVYKLKKALYGLKQAPKAWYDRLKAFLIKHEYKMGMVDNTLFTKKKSSNLIIVQIYVDDIIFGLTCQDMCDEFAKIMHDEFEMSMMGELNFFLGLQIKQMEDGIFFNQSKYIKEMLKKFGLEESKPMKTPMSSDTKLTKDEECESVDSTKYRGMIGDYVDRKSTSGICTFVGCCLTSWFSKKQTALAISTTEAEYVSAGKACQQALWMK
ncbi:retrovirus-related pol polyprotein from transposon TNT 1-94 [Tanacetum coccineum]